MIAFDSKSRKWLVFSFMLLLIVLSVSAKAQLHLRKINRYDDEGKRHGYWVMNSNTDSSRRIFKGRYNHGSQTGRCVFYYEDGTRYMVLHYKNDSLARMKRYDLRGKLELKGWALWLKNEKELRFCWDGDFVFYDSRRRVTGKAKYIRGIEQYEE